MTIADVAAARGAKLVHANGIDIAYAEAGDGPPLVLLHGGLASGGPAWAGSPVAYVDHMATLGRRFRVIAPDTRGSGATVNDDRPATFDVLTDDVIALIEALDLGPVYLMGFSEGGMTATMVALKRPDLVRALVNDAGFDYFDPSAPAHHSIRPMFGGSPDATEANPDHVQQVFSGIPPMAATLATMQADYDSAQGEGHWRRYLQLFFERSTQPLQHTVADFARLTVPTLILVGDGDMFCSVDLARQVASELKDGQLVIVPDAGHEIPAAKIDAVVEFLTSE